MDYPDTLAAVIEASEHVVLFTGAGISTESGIPDFRSPGGVWSKMDPIRYEDFVSDPAARREDWRRVFEDPAGWTGARPNVGHRAIARLIELGKVASVITQNVDNLHQDAGVPDERILEIHGNGSYAACLQCGEHASFDALRPRWEAGEELTCECGGLLKRAVISFGQSMPEHELMLAQHEALSCDLMIALGSSLVVYPAAGIPLAAKQNKATYIIINREETEHDPFADLVVRAEIGPLLEATMAALGSPLPAAE